MSTRINPVPSSQYAPAVASHSFPITPSDTAALPRATIGVYVGGAGDVAAILNEDGPAFIITPETLDPAKVSPNLTLSDGDLTAQNIGNANGTVLTVDSVNSGKWLVEATVTAAADGAVAQIFLGICDAGFPLADKLGLSVTDANAVSVSSSDATTISSVFFGNASSGPSFGAGSSFANGDVVGLALDLTTGANVLHFYKNGTLLGTFDLTGNSLGGKTWFFAASLFAHGSNNPETVFNFGTTAFAHPVAGYGVLSHSQPGTATIFKAVPVGTTLPISAGAILNTGTTATNLVGLY